MEPTFKHTKYGIDVSSSDVKRFNRKVDAQEYAKAQGWRKSDVFKACYGKFWGGWIVGQFVYPTMFEGFAENGELVQVNVERRTI